MRTLLREGFSDVAGSQIARPFQDRSADRAGPDGRRTGRRRHDRCGAGRCAGVAAMCDDFGGEGARADQHRAAAGVHAAQHEFFLPQGGSGQRRTGGALAQAADALLSRVGPRSRRGNSCGQPCSVRCGGVRAGRGIEARGCQLPFRSAGQGIAQAREGRGLPRDLLGDDRARSGLAGRTAWTRLLRRARKRVAIAACF